MNEQSLSQDRHTNDPRLDAPLPTEPVAGPTVVRANEGQAVQGNIVPPVEASHVQPTLAPRYQAPQTPSPQPQTAVPITPEGGAIPHDHAGLEFLSTARDIHAFEEAARHSDRVKRLRLIFPVVGGLIIFALLAVLAVSFIGGGEASLGNIGFNSGKLIMENPKLTGTDSDKRPYSMTAERAWQDVSDPTKVTLQIISAQLSISDENTAKLNAGTGFYDTNTQQLRLGEKIHIKTDDNMTVEMQDADINIEKGTLTTDKPIVMTSEKASISAGKLNVENKGEKIIFDGGVKINIEAGAFSKGDKGE